MRVLRMFPLALCGLLLLAIAVPGARADTWNKKTIVTFDHPVQIPGQVLEPGTYVFKVMTPQPRNAVQVWNKNQDRLIAIFLTNPEYRAEPYDDSVFHLRRDSSRYWGAEAQPMFTLRSWYYSGDTDGRVPLYPVYPTTEFAMGSHAGSMETTR